MPSIGRWALIVLVMGTAGCASEPSDVGRAPTQCITPPGSEIRLAVQRIDIDGNLGSVTAEALPLAHAALLSMQHRLRAIGGAGVARFVLRSAVLKEETQPAAQDVAPVTRHEGWLKFEVILQDTDPPPQPVAGEVRSTMVMVGYASPAERAWVCQQITHEAVERMGRDLQNKLRPWIPDAARRTASGGR